MLVRLHLQSEEEIVLVMEINKRVKLGEGIKDRCWRKEVKRPKLFWRRRNQTALASQGILLQCQVRSLIGRDWLLKIGDVFVSFFISACTTSRKWLVGD